MFFDILAVFVVSLISSLFLCTTCVHGFPSSPTKLHYIHSSPSADFSSSLRLLTHRPVLSVDSGLSGDDYEMLIGDSKENDDLSLSSIDISNEPFEYYFEPSPSKVLPRKLLLLQNQHQQKRSSPSSSKTHYNVNAVAAKFAGSSSHTKNDVNVNPTNEPIRLSDSLKTLVETNPFARIWLKMLVQKMMEEQNAPTIFKYG